MYSNVMPFVYTTEALGIQNHIHIDQSGGGYHLSVIL